MAVPGLTSLRDALARVLRSGAQPLIEVEGATERLPQHAIGRVLRAQVIAQLPNGRSVVDVQGAPFQVKLPVPARVGDTLELEVLTLEPRPTFALRSAPTPPVEFAGDTARLAAREVGQVFQAQVVAELPNARSSIEIEGERYDVKLPVQARAGDKLLLEVRAVEPRVLIAVTSAAPGAPRDPVAMSESVRRLAALLDRISAAPANAATANPATAAATPSAARTSLPIGTSPVTTPPPIVTPPLPASAQTNPALSPRSDAVAPTTAVSNTTPVVSATGVAPLLPSPPGNGATLAESLRLALAQSGFFYESHQSQWVAGQRPLEDLMREPQASLKPTSEPIHPQAIGLVRQQLEILDTRQLVWQGQVWPDQSMEWRVEEDRTAAKGPDDLPVWRTSLRLKLPRLGDVTATLALQGDEVRLGFTDLAPDTRSAMRNGQVTLRDAFAKAGLALAEMKVGRDEA
jgi:hypothetical protein